MSIWKRGAMTSVFALSCMQIGCSQSLPVGPAAPTDAVATTSPVQAGENTLSATCSTRDRREETFSLQLPLQINSIGNNAALVDGGGKTVTTQPFQLGCLFDKPSRPVDVVCRSDRDGSEASFRTPDMVIFQPDVNGRGALLVRTPEAGGGHHEDVVQSASGKLTCEIRPSLPARP